MPMAHDVFISYASKDKPIADAVCATLEARRIRCWIAPRDIFPGVNYARSIIDAINACRVLILVFSSSSNTSPQVMREVERAVSKGLPILPFRIEDVPLSQEMEYFISSPHWLDALTPPREKHLEHLAHTVALLLDRPGEGDGTADSRSRPEPRRAEEQAVPLPPTVVTRKSSSGSLVTVGLLVALVAAGGVGTWTRWHSRHPAPRIIPHDARSFEEAADACSQNLREIGRALAAYYRDNRHLPAYLSELYPRYLADKQWFHCPADPSPGKPGQEGVRQDPKLPNSYEYSDSNSMGGRPLGGRGGDWPQTKMMEDLHYGDRIPLVRCWHHDRPPAGVPVGFVLDLSRTGQIYRDKAQWDGDPATVRVVLASIERDLDAGAGQLCSRWALDRIARFFVEVGTFPALRDRYRVVAEKLAGRARTFPCASASDLAAAVGSLYRAAGDLQKAIANGEAAAGMPGEHSTEPFRLLANLYHDAGRDDRAIPFLQRVMAREPDNGDYLIRLADAYQSTGQSGKAIPTILHFMSTHSESPGLIDRLVVSYEKTGQKEKAAAWRRKRSQRWP
jgi:tetratricopeptide (TPR) repeat protein